MPNDSRIEELRRRLLEDPRSIAFAQLGEELRRAGRLEEALDICRAGLTIYPAYLSARVTVGRALGELNRLEDAQKEIQDVLTSAPEHVGAMRALIWIQKRRGPVASLEESVLPRPPSQLPDDRERLRTVRTLTVLESWLAAIHVARANRSA